MNRSLVRGLVVVCAAVAIGALLVRFWPNLLAADTAGAVSAAAEVVGSLATLGAALAAWAAASESRATAASARDALGLAMEPDVSAGVSAPEELSEQGEWRIVVSAYNRSSRWAASDIEVDYRGADGQYRHFGVQRLGPRPSEGSPPGTNVAQFEMTVEPRYVESWRQRRLSEPIALRFEIQVTFRDEQGLVRWSRSTTNQSSYVQNKPHEAITLRNVKSSETVITRVAT